MAIDSLAIISHGWATTPDGGGVAYDITVEDASVVTEDG